MTAHRRQHGGVIGRVLTALFVVVTLLSIYLLRAPILRSAARVFIIEDELQPADAILVLGDDNYPADRAARGAELFHGRWAPVVVASGRYLRPYASVSDLMARDLAERGVAAEHIVPLRHNAASTRQEAREIGKLAQERRWRRLIVVTSSYHTRRTRYVFRDVLPAEIELRVTPATDVNFDPDTWWQSREGRKTFVRESLAWVLAWWESFTGDDGEQKTGLTPANTPSLAGYSLCVQPAIDAGCAPVV